MPMSEYVALNNPNLVFERRLFGFIYFENFL